jgi:APA family basic amino acid/polyamine antiporter
MAVVGIVAGLANGMVQRNFTTIVQEVAPSTALFTAVVATAFAYEGWIVATSINAELRNSRKNLPIALVAGTFLVMAVYILYYIGLSGAVTNETLMAGGQEGAKLAFQTMFSNVAGTLIFVFVIISCLGTLNGLMVGCTRGMYSIAVRGEGPRPDVFVQVDKATNMPTNSSIIGLLLAGVWLVFFYGANLTKPWFGFFCFDSSELPIVTIYAMYIPIFLMLMKKEKDLPAFKRFVAPALSIVGSVFMIVAAVFAHRMAVVAYLIVFSAVMGVGAFFARGKRA